MPVKEAFAATTAIVVAGWVTPNNAYRFDNSYTYSETNLAEQTYSGYNLNLMGVETLDKIFARIKYITKVTTDTTGDDATTTMTLRVYDGTSWTNKQVTKRVFNVSTTPNAESLTDTEGDTTNTDQCIDITSIINTKEKLADVQLRLLFAVTENKQITLLLAAYVDCVAGDIGKTVTDDGVSVGILVSYDNVARTWVINTSATIADGSVMAITAGTGAGTTTGAQTGITVRWSVDGVSLLACYHVIAGIPATGLATTKYSSPRARKALQAVEAYLKT